MFTQLDDKIWNVERGFRLVETGLQLQAGTGSFPSFPSHSIEKHLHLIYFLLWGSGKQARMTRLQYTCRAVHAWSWSGKSTSGGSQPCRSALYGAGRAWGGGSPYREYVEICCILSEHGVTIVLHSLPWCWHRWSYDIGSDSAGGVACQEGHNPQFHSLDTHTNNSHAARDDVGRYTQGNCRLWCHNRFATPEVAICAESVVLPALGARSVFKGERLE